MNREELKTKYEETTRILRRERKMREFVYRGDPTLQTIKTAEIDKAIEHVTAMKDELKKHLATPEQQPLLPPPVYYP